MHLWWLLLGLLWVLPGVASPPLQVFVSVLPQQGLVEAVAGEYASVNVLVGPGQSPETYELTPRQLVSLNRADIYLRIGMPFEEVWLPKIRATYPQLRVIDLRDGLEMISAGDGHTVGHEIDPHVWTDPVRLRYLLSRIRDVLSEFTPVYQEVFHENALHLDTQLEQLDLQLQRQFSRLKTKEFLVLHPAWGYFAQRYGLKQLAIEQEGKEATSQYLANMISRLRETGLNKIFVQPQSNQKQAKIIASGIDAQLVVVDPLAKDMIQSLKRFAGHILDQPNG